MRREEEVRLTHSGIFAKDGRRCVSVRFERGRDVAEAILPACRVTKNEGFTDEEVRGLEQYLESKNDEMPHADREPMYDCPYYLGPHLPTVQPSRFGYLR